MEAEGGGLLGREFARETDGLSCARRATRSAENSFLPVRLGLSPNVNHFKKILLMSSVLLRVNNITLMFTLNTDL